MKKRTWIWISGPLLAIVGFTARAERVERGTLVFDGVPGGGATQNEPLDGYLAYRQASVMSWSPAGSLLIATRFGDSEQLHSLASAGAYRRQLSFYSEPVTRAIFSPLASRNAYVFAKDAGGDENAQLYYQHFGSPTARLITDGRSRNGEFVWSHGGKTLAFFSTQRDGASSDIYLLDPESGALPKLVLAGDHTEWLPLDFSADDGRLLVLNRVSSASSHLYIVDLASGEKRELDAAKDPVSIGSARFVRERNGVYLTSNRDNEFLVLYYLDLTTGEKTPLSAHIPWDVEALELSQDGRYLAYVTNQNGISRLNVLDVQAKQEFATPNMGAGVIGNLRFDFASRRLAFDLATPTEPRDAYVLDLTDFRLERWTQSELGPVNQADFTTPEPMQYGSFDRQAGRPRQIPVYIYRAKGAGPHPVLIVIHGGPESQWRPSFDPWIQYVVQELGFSVVAPNIRGSSGYGKTYMSLDDGLAREDSVKDVGALLVWIGAQHDLDDKRVVVSGGSYGGYMALASLVTFGDRLRGAVEVAGISNFNTFLQNTAVWRRELRRAEYGDERDPNMRRFFNRISPLSNAGLIQRPLLVVAGKNDPRVPQSESDQLVNLVRLRNSEVWYLLAKDEGHGFRKKSNRDAYLRTFAAFLTRLK